MNAFVSLLFFISGACGLIYEVVWSRMMLLIFGRTALSVGTVLAAFMSGLALGSFLIGRYADKSRNPLRLYAFCEAGVGLTALAVSFTLTSSVPIYVWMHSAFGGSPLLLGVVRFSFAFLLLIVPTALMGATLPILSRLMLRQRGKVAHELGRLYAINTIGAVAGSLATGFYLIGHIGLHHTVDVAVLGNLAVGAAAWFASRRFVLASDGTHPQPRPADASGLAESSDNTRRIYLIALLAFALSGLTSFAYEVFWTRSLVFLFGNTTYAFTLMLTAFLSGIALGGYGIRFAADRVKSPLRLFAAIEVLIGVFSAIALPLLFFIVKSETVRSFVDRMSGQLGLLAFSNYLIALLLMLLPAALIGATFPLLGRIFVHDLGSTAKTVGKVYAVNTLGNVLGALLPGLLILPLMGIQKGILLMAALNTVLGIVIISARSRRSMMMISSASAAFLLFALFLNRESINFEFPSEYESPQDAVFFYKEGGLVTTKVWDSVDSGYKMMSVDGINIGGTSDSDYKQQILAHLPKLLLKSYSSELSIGLGSGILIGESARHEALKRVVCVEISHGVVEGARHFSEENYGVLNDPRVVIVVDDVADFLHTTKDRFDIISADEKTTGKYATNAFSYSTEYYSLLRKRLSPGGLVIQWVPADLPRSQYLMVMRTFLKSFPHVMLWYFPPVGRFNMTNSFLVGSNERVEIDPEWMRKIMEAESGSFSGIRKYGLTTVSAILSHFVAGDEALRRAIPPGPVNSFDEPYYEFYSPKDYAVASNVRALDNEELLMSMREQDLLRLEPKGTDKMNNDRLNAAFQAEGIFLGGEKAQLQGRPASEVLQYYDQAVRKAPWDEDLRNEVVSYLYYEFRRFYAAGNYAQAAAFLSRATQTFPESAEVHNDYGTMLFRMNRADLALEEFQRSLALNPKLVLAHRQLALLYILQGQAKEAVDEWKTALRIYPYDIPSLVGYGTYLAGRGPTLDEAMKYLREAYRLAPENPAVRAECAGVKHFGENCAAGPVLQKNG